MPATGARLAVQHWPAARPLIEAGRGWDRGLLVIGVATPDSAIRATARRQIREALCEVLGILLDCEPGRVPLVSSPGQALRVDLPDRCIGVSVSHEPGLSLAAIHRHGPIGVDLMRVTDVIEWEAVAYDYLGPSQAARIACMAPSERSHAFARAWTCLEAGLKYLGLGLEEWSPALASRLQACDMIALDLPAGLAGTVAIAG